MKDKLLFCLVIGTLLYGIVINWDSDIRYKKLNQTVTDMQNDSVYIHDQIKRFRKDFYGYCMQCHDKDCTSLGLAQGKTQ
jgi:hypothetical protein